MKVDINGDWSVEGFRIGPGGFLAHGTECGIWLSRLVNGATCRCGASVPAEVREKLEHGGFAPGQTTEPDPAAHAPHG